MKITFAVPCYNSAAYMRKCIESLLSVDDPEAEIVLVDDGSTDDTPAIADDYAAKYPDKIRAVHQENRGHGGAVMTGLANARGEYFKVVDSDDWLDTSVIAEVLHFLDAPQEKPDMIVCNYVYDKVGAAHKKVMSYGNALPERRLISWDDVGHFAKGQYMLMHAVIYRTELLRTCGLDLPLHTFYVDNLFVYVPMAQVRTLYYIPCDLYHYFIGREDQSVHESVMIRRIDQQMRVNRLMVEQLDPLKVENRRAAKYLFNYLEIVTAVTCILTTISDSEENYRKRDALWASVKKADPKLCRKLRRGILCSSTCPKTRPGRKIAIAEYKLANKIFGFN